MRLVLERFHAMLANPKFSRVRRKWLRHLGRQSIGRVTEKQQIGLFHDVFPGILFNGLTREVARLVEHDKGLLVDSLVTEPLGIWLGY